MTRTLIPMICVIYSLLLNKLDYVIRWLSWLSFIYICSFPKIVMKALIKKTVILEKETKLFNYNYSIIVFPGGATGALICILKTKRARHWKWCLKLCTFVPTIRNKERGFLTCFKIINVTKQNINQRKLYKNRVGFQTITRF